MKKSISEKFIEGYKKLIPSPFSIALILTLLTFLLAFIFTKPTNISIRVYFLDLVEYWENGLWGIDKNSIGEFKVRGWQMPFIVQMMLMLVLGYVLALSKPVDKFISKVTVYCTSTAKAAFLVTLLTIIVSLFNWGLGLIFGAIFARKVGDFALKNSITLNYPLIGAAGYSGLMVWHGGISGSAPVKAAESGNLKSLINNPNIQLPDAITFEQTIFSSMNIVVSLALIIIVPLVMYFIGKRLKGTKIEVGKHEQDIVEENAEVVGAEKIDYSVWFSSFIGSLILFYALYKSIIKPDVITLKFITPDFINLTLLGLVLIFHKNITSFLKSLDKAIVGASGILVQFPLYFGIMGIMKYSGMMEQMADFFVNISSETTYPIYTFFSAGVVNIFVPSGGGQWAVQGPIIIEAAYELGASIPKSIIAMSYGDQLTNMLQPFWALPLLGITGLKAKDILPYTLLLMLIGFIIFTTALLIF